MDSAAIYTLVGALGGVIITQVASYYHEKTRFKNQLKIKQVDIDNEHRQTMLSEKRIAYAEYLKVADELWASLGSPKKSSVETLTPSFYRAVIVADSDTQKKIIKLFDLLKSYTVGDRKVGDDTHEEGSLMEVKADLVKSMRVDLDIT